MFPTEEDNPRKDKIGMGMICVSDSPNDIHVDYHDLFEAIPENSSNDNVSQEQP